ncbi:hypothetical protein NPIL_102611, partial [Nephila pilipes]
DSSNADQCMNHGPISNGFVLVIPNNRFQPSSSPSAQTDFEYPVGTRLHYSCTHGYVLRGERELVCESGGFWSEEVPVCMEAMIWRMITCEQHGQWSNPAPNCILMSQIIGE